MTYTRKLCLCMYTKLIIKKSIYNMYILGLFKKIMPYIYFFCRKYLINRFEIYTRYTWMFSFYIYYFLTISINFIFLRQYDTSACMPLLYQFLSCPHNHMSSLFESHPRYFPNLVPQSASLRDPKNWKSKKIAKLCSSIHPIVLIYLLISRISFRLLKDIT